jgi:hypothetical protein
MLDWPTAAVPGVNSRTLLEQRRELRRAKVGGAGLLGLDVELDGCGDACHGDYPFTASVTAR